MATQINTNQIKDGAVTAAKNGYIPQQIIASASVHSTLVVNTTDETTIMSVQIDGDTLGSTGEIRGEIHGYIYNHSGNDRTVTFRLKYGTETLGTASAPLTQNRDGPIDIFFNLAANAGESAQLGGIDAQWSGGSNSSGGGYDDGSSSQDSTGDLNLVVTAELSAADTDLKFYEYAYEVTFSDPG